MARALTSILAVLLAVAGPVAAQGGPALTTEFVGVFSSPTYLTSLPDDGRLFILERNGRIRVIRENKVLPTPFLNLSSIVDPFFEGGLLGMAFHPDYETNGRLYVNYTRTGGNGLVTVVAEYTVSDDPDIADPSSARTIIEIEQPAANHNGGWIGFSPNDHYLYIAMGDGGFEGSGPERAQQISNQLLGKMLRVDINGDDFPKVPLRNYAIPPDNPYVDIEGDDEIWALGLRNPYRCGFDRLTGDLWIADVGDFSFEEVDLQPGDSMGGENYGWGCMEAHSCSGQFCDCLDPELVRPIHSYAHAFGCAIVGGTAYRGCALEGLEGLYFFGDFCTGRTWTLRQLPDDKVEVVERTDELGVQDNLAAICEDHRGERYLLSLNGTINRIMPVDGDPMACAIPGDLNGDNDVSTADMLILLSVWGACTDPCIADLNDDGTVNVTDLLIMLAFWSEY